MKIGLIRYWIGRPAAEHETVERFKVAATLIGHEIVELRADGLGIDGNPQEVDFIINLHFASGKSSEVLTYGALWNPIDFYHGWGFRKTFANQISNNFLISCNARPVDSRFRYENFPLIINQILSHTVPPNYLDAVERTDRKLFYIGVNWERSTKTRGRHHELLKLLDEEGVLDIYGPQKLGDVVPWKGFKSYKGDLPFDGTSVYEAAHRSGAALVLSSQSHKQDEIMTSRLFESIAAGSAIIADSHKFLDKNFNGLIWKYDDKSSYESQAAQILEALDDINSIPNKAIENIRATQDILREKFNLALQLSGVALHAKEYLANKKSPQRPVADAIVFHDDHFPECEDFIESLIDAGFSRIFLKSHSTTEMTGIFSLDLGVNAKFDEVLSEYFSRDVTSEFVAVFTGKEQVFSSYLEYLPKIHDQSMGYSLTGTCVQQGLDNYATALNALSDDWHRQFLPNMLIKTQVLQDFSNLLGSYSVQSLLAAFAQQLISEGYLIHSPVTRFNVGENSSRIGEYIGDDYHKIINEVVANFSLTSNQLHEALLIKLIKNSRESVFQNYSIKSLLTSFYHDINLPKFLDKPVRSFSKKIFR